jgi:tRNA nucleotidyltransferase (CCA-adding enzyme)
MEVSWNFWLGYEHPGDVLLDVKKSELLPNELAALRNCPQDPTHHPEGDAYDHTAATCNAMANICRRERIKGDRRTMLLLTMLCHDMGKAKNTRRSDVNKRKYVSPGHEILGVPLATSFLTVIRADPFIINHVLPLVRRHMVHCQPPTTENSVLKLATNLAPANITDLLLVSEADIAGRRELSPAVMEMVLVAKRLKVLDKPGVSIR